MQTLTGRAVSGGFAAGPIYRYDLHRYTAENTPRTESAQEALERLRRASAQANSELFALHARLAENDAENAAIFLAHAEILSDEAISEDINLAVEDGASVEYAVQSVFTAYASELAAAKDARIRERAVDLCDVKNRLLRCLAGEAEQTLSALPCACIVAAYDLFPADTATLDHARVLGIATEAGSDTSHSTILARSFGLPAVVGLSGLMEAAKQGVNAALDAEEGRLTLGADATVLARCAAQREAFLIRRAGDAAFLQGSCRTADGMRVEIHLNIASSADKELAAAPYVDGVGLFRSEFLYMNRATLPDEQEQYAAYRRVLEWFQEKPVVLRTLDIGGDKQVSCLPQRHEENPFLGVRALRLCLENEPVFRTQLRAALRAAAHGNLWLMLPMVGSVEEVRIVRRILDEERATLRAAGKNGDAPLRLGVMIEIPSIALCADAVAREVDFASVGTNDLTQYLLAADRVDAAVAPYYHKYHPALFRLIRMAAEAFLAAGKPLSVCGELGGDPLAAPVLVGLGVGKLSMGAASVAAQKRVFSALRTADIRMLADQVCGCATEAEVEALLRQAYKNKSEA